MKKFAGAFFLGYNRFKAHRVQRGQVGAERQSQSLGRARGARYTGAFSVELVFMRGNVVDYKPLFVVKLNTHH